MSSALSQSYLDEYNGDQVIVCGAIFVVLSNFFVGLRLYARSISKSPWGWDDSLLIASLVLMYGVVAASIADVKIGGVGHHVEAVAPKELRNWAKFAFVIPLLVQIAFALPKLSIVALFLRVFAGRRNRLISWATATILVLNLFAGIIAAFLMCIPLQFMWDKDVPGGRCFNINAWYRWSSFGNILTDVIMLVQPIPVALKLQASTNIKLGVIASFATGSIGLVTALIRFAGFFTEDMAHDATWTATKLIIISIIEVGMYLISACLVRLKPLAARIFPKTFLSHENTKATSKGTFTPSPTCSRGVQRRDSDLSEDVSSGGGFRTYTEKSFTLEEIREEPK